MICKWCNKEVDNNSQFCVHCGKSLIEGNNISNVNMNEGVSGESNLVTTDKVNVWLVILSWFIPLVGFILFFVKKKESPKTAKACGICSLISFILSFIVCLAVFAFTFYTYKNVSNAWDEQINDYVQDEFEDSNDNVDNDEDEEKDDNKDVVIDTNVSKDWKKYEVSINGQTIALPTDYKTLSKITGFTYQSSVEKSYLQAKHYTYLNMYNGSKLALYVDVINDTKEDLLYTDCKITRITQTKYQMSNSDIVVVFPGGLKAGQEITEAAIIDLFGKPDDTYEYSSENYNTKTYTYLEDTNYTTTNKYEIKIVNGVIDELELDKRY